jgi:site-specific recombinase XerD
MHSERHTLCETPLIVLAGFSFMKVNNIFNQYLSYCAAFGGHRNMGNTLKTLTEKKRFLSVIDEAIGERDIEDLTEYDVVRVRDIGTRHGTYGAQRSVIYLKQFLDYAETRLNIRIKFNYRKLKLPYVPEKNIEYLTPDELRRVREAFDISTPAGLRTRTLIEFMMATALRIGEVCSIDKANFNLETGEFKFRDKYGCDQKMVCPPNAIQWIKLYLNSRHDDCPALFISGRSRLLPRSSKGFIRTKIKPLQLNKKCAHHIIRKTCGTNLLLDTDIKSTQVFLRHKNPETTLKHYTAITDMQTREATAKVTNRYVSEL